MILLDANVLTTQNTDLRLVVVTPRPDTTAREKLDRMAALVYLGVLLVLSQLQSKLIFPGQATQGAPFSAVQPETGEEVMMNSAKFLPRGSNRYLG